MGVWHLALSGLDEWHALERKSANMDFLDGRRGNGWRDKRGVFCGFFELRVGDSSCSKILETWGAIRDIEVLTS